jgi:hypothetical protein
MNQLRKIIIGLVAAAVVVIAFMIISNSSDSMPVEQTQGNDRSPIERHDFSETTKIGGSGISNAKNSGFITRDPITKKVIRIFSFEELLNPKKNSEKWRLKKPHMQFFGDEFECKITSDEGNFQVERVMGKLTPQNARLYGNVKLEIKFQNEGVPTEGIVYLDDLDYDSEMSKLDTDKSVRAVFKDAVMEGTGMRLIYNSAKSRIEYFEMKDLDFIRIKNLAMLSKDRKETDTQTDAPTKSNVTEKNTTAKTTVKTTVKPAATTVNDTQSDQPQPQADYYHCRFLKDVIIEYGNELVVKGDDELNIKNLLFSQASPNQASTDPPAAEATPAKDSSKETSTKEPSKETLAKKPSQPTVIENVDMKKDAASDKPVVAQSSDVPEEATEVVLTCKQGFVVQLMSKVRTDKTQTLPVAKTIADTMATLLSDAGNAKAQKASDTNVDQGLIYVGASPKMDVLLPDTNYANFVAGADTKTDTTTSKSQPAAQIMPTRFHAKKIDYDMTTKYAYATGPIDLLIYGEPDPNAGPDQPQVPINIKASESTEYFGFKGQVIFNGDVKGIRKVTDKLYVTVNTVRGDKLVVDLDSTGQANSISHVSVLGEDVGLLSTRKSSLPDEDIDLDKIHTEEDFLTRISLECVRIDYDGANEFVLAKGPGEIVLNNSNAPTDESSNDDPNTQVTLKEPCYALMEGFDSLKWYTVKKKVIVDGSSDSFKIQHLPVVDGQYGKITLVLARNIEANFLTTPLGRTELSNLTASDTVSFQERYSANDVINSFIGDNLFYDVPKSKMVITGTERNPCMANGLNADKITYNLATGELVTGISGTSTIHVQPKKPPVKRPSNESSIQLPPKPKDLKYR